MRFVSCGYGQPCWLPPRLRRVCSPRRRRKLTGAIMTIGTADGIAVATGIMTMTTAVLSLARCWASVQLPF